MHIHELFGGLNVAEIPSVKLVEVVDDCEHCGGPHLRRSAVFTDPVTGSVLSQLHDGDLERHEHDMAVEAAQAVRDTVDAA
ncbi:hypothetical protein SAMN06264364_11828 [Quadrisphaera granulorum]|uniref:Uncharacterized protein n=1 Tax=Quadrisphaera granulorum TaxID=317664 RepID=A0A316ARE5_9ACTN|nr:hypothetical protein [Quadrisphaera granulorum]PWJ52657.1 hypothetical protein BXY45_11828 [Quadrisphaera granulorum]SZE97479.1 hypothetical protein SAMN06264364_11828 [Quadrisphaera granulorum]